MILCLSELWMAALSAPASVCANHNEVKCYIGGRLFVMGAEVVVWAGRGAIADSIVMLTGPIEVKPFIFETWIKTGRCCWFQRGGVRSDVVQMPNDRTFAQLPHDVWLYMYKSWHRADGPVMPIEWACLLRAMFDYSQSHLSLCHSAASLFFFLLLYSRFRISETVYIIRLCGPYNFALHTNAVRYYMAVCAVLCMCICFQQTGRSIQSSHGHAQRMTWKRYAFMTRKMMARQFFILWGRTWYVDVNERLLPKNFVRFGRIYRRHRSPTNFRTHFRPLANVSLNEIQQILILDVLFPIKLEFMRFKMADTEPIGHFEYIKCYDQMETKLMVEMKKQGRVAERCSKWFWCDRKGGHHTATNWERFK